VKSLSIIPYFKKITEEKIIIGLFDFDDKGIDCIQRAKGNKAEVKREIESFRNKKKPIIQQYENSHFLTLIPPQESNSWSSHLSNPYELENLKIEYSGIFCQQ
jgi:adenylate kinase family enzyme